MKKYSLITTNYRREPHLKNLLQGLRQGLSQPDEIIIVEIGEAPARFNRDINNIRQIAYPYDGKGAVPVIQARNYGAASASCDQLIFLDADIIPSLTFLSQMREYSEMVNGIIMGNPRFMTTAVKGHFDDGALFDASRRHPFQPRVNAISEETRYELFWSLCFLTTKAIFDSLGGFDPGYMGYRGEDTDFAYKAKKKGIPFYQCDATVFHQSHPFFVPPLNEFEAIVFNCNYFMEKWGVWPMEEHLRHFRELGLITWQAGQKTPITIRNKPSAMEISQSERQNLPFAY